MKARDRCCTIGGLAIASRVKNVPIKVPFDMAAILPKSQAPNRSRVSVDLPNSGQQKADWRSLRPRLEIHRYPRTDPNLSPGLRNNQSTLQTGQKVAALVPRGEGWEVQTNKKTFNARWVVNAAGAWANEVAQLAGLSPIDLTPMRRTAAMIEAPVEAGEWPVVYSMSGDLYFKPEGASLMVSPQDETPSPPVDAFPRIWISPSL